MPGFMRGSRNFCQAGGGGSRPDGQKTVWTMCFLVINLFYNLQGGTNGFITEGGGGVQLLPGEEGGGCPKKPI